MNTLVIGLERWTKKSKLKVGNHVYIIRDPSHITSASGGERGYRKADIILLTHFKDSRKCWQREGVNKSTNLADVIFECSLSSRQFQACKKRKCIQRKHVTHWTSKYVDWEEKRPLVVPLIDESKTLCVILQVHMKTLQTKKEKKACLPGGHRLSSLKIFISSNPMFPRSPFPLIPVKNS